MSTKIIDRFIGKNYFLDNFYPSNCIYDGERYATTEHAFQAAKSLDPRTRVLVALCNTPAEAKAFGRNIKPLREDWDQVKVSVMEEILRSKFTRHDDLRQKLLETGDAILIEGNNHRDRFWGQYKGEGKNMLGTLLMKLREEFRNENIN